MTEEDHGQRKAKPVNSLARLHSGKSHERGLEMVVGSIRVEWIDALGCVRKGKLNTSLRDMVRRTIPNRRAIIVR
jgi:hypothetical protein